MYIKDEAEQNNKQEMVYKIKYSNRLQNGLFLLGEVENLKEMNV